MAFLAALTMTGWLSQTQAISLTGEAAYYQPGLMAQVAEARGLGLEGYAGGVALMACGDLGREVWLHFPGESWDGPFLVVDCSRRDHYRMNLERGRVVDVDRAVWDQHRLPARPSPVVVRFAPPGYVYNDPLTRECRPL